MDFSNLGLQIIIALVAIAFLWIFFKMMKVIWKLMFIFLALLALSFALPAFREWIFNLF